MSGGALRSSLPPLRRADWLAGVLLTITASGLLLANLGNQYLWQDEAQTALIADTILDAGVPLGHDGVNSFSQEFGAEFGKSGVWKWHTWLSFYLCAASLWLFGATTFAARLPFALFGVATVILTGWVGRALWRDRAAAVASAGLLTLSVPFLILCRQCRYYSPAAFFTLLALFAYVRLRRGERHAGLLLFVAATLLFHTHYLYCATLLATLLLHALGFDRPRLRRVIAVSAWVVLVNLPWILWFSTIRYGENYASRVRDLGLSLDIAQRLCLMIADYLFHPVFALAALGLAAWRWAWREPVLGGSPETRSHVALLLGFCAVNVVALALAAPSAYFRYLAPLAPPLFLLAGLLVSALLRRSRWLAAAVLAVWLSLGSLHRFVYELRHDFDGPIEGIVATLRQHAAPGDVVAINYGDLPVKFYTGLRVVGGLTGESLDPIAEADWIILRRDDVGAQEDARIRLRMKQQLATGGYRLRVIDYPDTAFENREDPHLHRFRTAEGIEGVRLYQRVRGAGFPSRVPTGAGRSGR
jgi:4-amino-4-deoxy-L-arabinose transferase-like glycosyltransferase